ncbi:putative metal-dependent HD superfamily phosphohydrolase/outer membrane protein assembly factor BamB [Kribbella italica]|uniref:Putative metal-dependent HD superfamily phosphohydrolase/outer membrane protein assembly factor BamB n=1 Tax=Kribbella italica TaxID=1540520 RepID=A0A7W9JC62_9ACTN|nr:putative metal-dependent HD superfamily phosphohydrolase/outer membrane protein assembly factor BamB [Kribbella italica]
MTGLRERWNDLIPGAAVLADDLAARYRADDRRAYRDQYLHRVLDALGTLDQLSTDPTAVYLAAWFHRAVHEPGGQSDAEASAVLAEQELPSYHVTAARTAEVARLIRLTGTPPPWSDDLSDPNAYVLLDAVNATAAGPNYATHAVEVRRDAPDRSTAIKLRHALVQRLLDGPIFRTQLGRDRYAAAARANLARELEVLDGEIPAPWRGWQRAALVGVAVISPLLAAAASFGATGSSWQSGADGGSAWPAWVLNLVALASVFLLQKIARSNNRRARVLAGVFSTAAVAGLVIAVLLIPDRTPSNGPGGRVPLVIISLGLLLIGGLAALAASTLTAPLPARNRGQLVAALLAAAAVVAATVFVADPVGRSYLLQANEQITGTTAPEVQAPRSELGGRIAWVSPTTSLRADAVSDAVATRHGIAISRQTGTVEMLDPGSGEVRWRYSRSDTAARPRLYAAGDGQLLLADFDDFGYLMLDAATGRRTPGWPRSSTRDHSIENADPLLTGKQVSKGSDKLRGLDADGKDRWTFEPGRCTSIGATATADTVVTFLGHSCGGKPDELTALDLETGKQLWSRPADWQGVTRLVFDGLVVVLENREGSPGVLVAIEARTGEVKWRWDLPTTWACDSKVAAAGRQVVLLNCPSKAAKQSAVVATVLDAQTGNLAWQRTVPGDLSVRSTITGDARVVSVRETTHGCDLTVLTSTGQRRVALPDEVECRRGIHALGNQLLVSGEDTVIALR